MSNVQAQATTKETTISAVITRADGTVEDLGVISRRKEFVSKGWLRRLRDRIERVTRRGEV